MTGTNLTRAGVAALLVAGLATGAATSAGAATASARSHHHVTGDFDGDGRRDLAIGAPGGDRVRITYTHAIRHGSHTGFITGHAPHPTPTGFGASLAVGDFNGDGFSDLAVGAPEYRPKHQHGGFGNPEPQGAVFEYFGSASGLHQQPLELTGPYDGDEPFYFGSSIAAGDTDHDGRSDLAVTIPFEDPAVQVFYGSATGLRAGHPTDLLDNSEADSVTFGDVNGDRHADLIIGSTFDFTSTTDGDPGSLTVHYGSSHGIRHTAHFIHGVDVGVLDLGAALDTGDIDHDGYADVVAGAPGDHQHGSHRFPGSIVVLFGSRHGLHSPPPPSTIGAFTGNPAGAWTAGRRRVNGAKLAVLRTATRPQESPAGRVRAPSRALDVSTTLGRRRRERCARPDGSTRRIRSRPAPASAASASDPPAAAADAAAADDGGSAREARQANVHERGRRGIMGAIAKRRGPRCYRAVFISMVRSTCLIPRPSCGRSARGCRPACAG